MDCVEQILVAETVLGKLTPGFHGPHAHRDITMSGDKNNRDFIVCCGQFRWSSIPLKPGRRTSSTRHAGAVRPFARRKSFADENISTRKPTRSDQLPIASRIAALSSTTKTFGPTSRSVATAEDLHAALVFCRQNELNNAPGPMLFSAHKRPPDSHIER